MIRHFEKVCRSEKSVCVMCCGRFVVLLRGMRAARKYDDDLCLA